MMSSWDEAQILARALRALHGEAAPWAAMELARNQPPQAVAVLAAAAGLMINPAWPEAEPLAREAA